MGVSDDVRPCFAEPLPEAHLAADLLHDAAVAVSRGDIDLARSKLTEADFASLHEFTSRLMGAWDVDTHGGPKPKILENDVVNLGARAPSKSAARAIYARDGFRCRYCGCRIIVPEAIPWFQRHVPGGLSWGPRNRDQHSAVFTLKGVLDHVTPFRHGGQSDELNLVVSCQPCNYGKWRYTLDQIRLSDPRDREPYCDSWDGLSSFAWSTPVATNPGKIAPKMASAPTAPDPPMTEIERQWAEFARSCADLSATYVGGATMALRLTVGAQALDVIGFDGDVAEIPWSIGPSKKEFETFCDRLVAALPGSIKYETAKMWRVKYPDRRVTMSELLRVQYAIRQGLADLKARLEPAGMPRR